MSRTSACRRSGCLHAAAVLCVLLLVGCDNQADDPRCSSTETSDVLEDATEDQPTVIVDCDLTLSASDSVTKTLIVEGSDAITIDCGGALLNGGHGTVNAGRDMIQVRSRNDGNGYDPATDITIRDCQIVGSVRTWGMGERGESPAVQKSSINENHVRTVRTNAPSRIRYENLDIEATGRSPFYVAPGVTQVTLTGSHLHGRALSSAIYLDAESAYNQIVGNRIEVVTVDTRPNNPFRDRYREEVAIDGSSWNVITGNRFSALNHGGIYLYRNCGEGGTVRHSTPSNNIIVNNVFYYDEYDGDLPSIFLGARDGDRPYCDDDDQEPFGSGADDRDFAQRNIIAQNQIYKLPVAQMIRAGGTVNSPNLILDNITVTAAEDPFERTSGCAFFADGEPHWVMDGDETSLTPDPVAPEDGFRIPGVADSRYKCDDGDLGEVGPKAKPVD